MDDVFGKTRALLHNKARMIMLCGGSVHIPRVLPPPPLHWQRHRQLVEPDNEACYVRCSSSQTVSNPRQPTTFLKQGGSTGRGGPRSQLSIGRGVKSRCKISHKFRFHGRTKIWRHVRHQITAGTLHKSQIGLLFVCARRIGNAEKSLW